jgi:DNA-binding CsgD family transcriptional regulator
MDNSTTPPDQWTRIKNRQVRNRAKAIRTEKDLETIADLYATGWRQSDIAEHLGISTEKVNKSIVKIRQRWLESQTMDFAIRQAVELEKLDRLESELWEAWQKSKKGLKKKISSDILRSSPRGDQTEKLSAMEEIDQPGEVKYLELIAKIVAQRCKILGLDAPTVIQHTGEIALNSYSISGRSKLNDDQKINLMFTYLQKLAEQPKLQEASEEVIEGEMFNAEEESIKAYSARAEGDDIQRAE